jgi:hypothetical protein
LVYGQYSAVPGEEQAFAAAAAKLSPWLIV